MKNKNKFNRTNKDPKCPKCGNAFWVRGSKCYGCGYE